MPATGAYTLHLYCDCKDCLGEDRDIAYDEAYCRYNNIQCGFSEYSGETYAECVGIARKDGWQIGHNRQTCYAPGHKRS